MEPENGSNGRAKHVGQLAQDSIGNIPPAEAEE